MYTRNSWQLWAGGLSCLLVATVLAIGACSQGKVSTLSKAVADDDRHGLHTINNERLRLLMDELCRLDFDRLSAEMQAGMKPYRDISEVAVTAAILAADARMIPSVYKDAGLNEERRHAFDQLANKLHDETLELNELAKNNDLPKIRAQLNQVVATCNACHASFRGPKVAGITKPTSK